MSFDMIRLTRCHVLVTISLLSRIMITWGYRSREIFPIQLTILTKLWFELRKAKVHLKHTSEIH